MKKQLFFLFICSLVLLHLVGCTPETPNEETTPDSTTEITTDTTTEGTTPATVPEETTTPGDITVTPPEDDTVSFEDVFGVKNVSFTAQPFLQDVSIASDQTAVEVEVLDQAIVVDGIFYTYAELIDNPPVVYPQQFSSATDKTPDEIYGVLSEIRTSQGYYIRETKNGVWNNRQIAIYKIQGIHYILTFYRDETVAEIYCVNASEADMYITIEFDHAQAYTLAAKIPTKWNVEDGDIPILLSFGVIEEDYIDLGGVSAVGLEFWDNRDFYEFKKIDIAEILKPDYVAVRNEQQKGTLAYNYAHTEVVYLPLSLLSNTSGVVAVFIREHMANDVVEESDSKGVVAVVQFYYVCDEESIFIGD